MKRMPLTQDDVDELNAIYGLDKRGKNKKRILVWESALDACDLGGYLVIPLTSSWALRKEGQEMRHCVGIYDKQCANGLVRVFSIRDFLGQRLATMSIVFEDDSWQLEQVAGLMNEEVCISRETIYDGEETQTIVGMTEIHYVACEIVRLYREVWESSRLGSK